MRYLTGGDCFVLIDMMNEQYQRTLHPAAKPCLTRFKRLMLNIAIFVHMDHLAQERIKSTKHSLLFDYSKDCVIPFEAMKSGFDYALLQLKQQDFIAKKLDVILNVGPGFGNVKFNNQTASFESRADQKKLRLARTLLLVEGLLLFSFVSFVSVYFVLAFFCDWSRFCLFCVRFCCFHRYRNQRQRNS